MSDRSGPPSDEGEGDDLRPHGSDRDSSEESSDEDPEEARRIAEGFIQDDDDEEEEDPEAARERRRKEKRRRKKREKERRARHEAELSDDELELLQENRGISGRADPRPFKRVKRASGSPVDEEDEKLPTLQDIFRDEEERRALEDDDEDDMGDFIEEDEEEEEARGETEEQRRERKRAEKLRRREAAKARPDAAGMDRGSWDEIFAVFGDGQEFDWAMEGEEAMDEDEEAVKKDLRLEDVFDPAEIKARRLQDEDKAITQADRPERHQLVNSTLSDNPILAPDTLFPPPALAANWAYDKISPRTSFFFCLGSDTTGEFRLHLPRSDLRNAYIAAVTTALDMMFVQHLEVPFLWHYKRDSFSVLENQGRSTVQFLERDELWTLYTLGIKYRAIHDRCDQITKTWKKIRDLKPGLEDEYLETTLLASTCVSSVEAAADGYNWLVYHYPEQIRQIKEDEALEDGNKRLLEKSAKEDMRKGPIMKLVEEFGISVSGVATSFKDPAGVPAPNKLSQRMPLEAAAEFSGDGTYFIAPEEALKAAHNILVTDFFKDPTIRQQAREMLSFYGRVTVTPTERGMSVIDQYHAYYTFKFLTDKPVERFKETPQFLHMLKAEEEGLIDISISISQEAEGQFINGLVSCARSNDYGEIATAWDQLRSRIMEELFQDHLAPMASKWVKEDLKSQAEEFVADRCAKELEYRIMVKPFASARMDPGDVPSMLALSNGQGNFKDAVMAVMLDDEGHLQTQTKFDNLRDEADRTSFIELVSRKRPRVIVVGGLSVQAAKVRDDVMMVLRHNAGKALGREYPLRETYPRDEEHNPGFHDQQFQEDCMDFDREAQQQGLMPPVIFVNDATARQYMHSEDAKQEFPTFPVNGRYALALARYAQSPLNAYCKLGKGIASVTFQEQHQKLVSTERLLVHLERALVNVTCFNGLEVNITAADHYQRAMLPFIAGLGPRKADALVNGINRHGTLVNRLAFSMLGLFGPVVLENAVGFLSIDNDLNVILEKENPQDQPDPLDKTRIHPADYEFAQKMAQDALDLDADDVADQHPSASVQQLMLDDGRDKMMRNLELGEYAFNLQGQGSGNKRHILQEIVDEIVQWRSDKRYDFFLLSEWEILQMLTGETEFTIGKGLIVTATVRKALKYKVLCQLDCGVEAILTAEHADIRSQDQTLDQAYPPRRAFKAIVLQTRASAFSVDISARPEHLQQGRNYIQPFADDAFNDTQRQADAEERAAQKKRRKAGAVKRVVNHPNWHVMNSGQAEQYLASQQRGDVVIRPSSKGSDHLAVTWKVDEDVYQHIDVKELDKPNEYSIGRVLRVADKYSYSDLDELIINHVKAMARKFDEMQSHEKYRPEDELEAYLKNYVQAHPGRSMYGFSINSEHPGYLTLCFLNKSTKDGGVIQKWPVKVLPGAYQLNDASIPGVQELCNAFKTQYTARLMEQGGKTPGVRAGKTPLPGGRTPGAMRGGATPYGAGQGRTPMIPGRTPNPYMNAPPPQAAYGGMPPRPPFPPGGQPAYGQPPPGQGGFPPRPPPGMGGPGFNPERAAMIARQGGRY